MGLVVRLSGRLKCCQVDKLKDQLEDVMIRLSNIRVPVKDICSLDQEEEILARVVASKLRISRDEVKDLRIHKKSIDARKKDKIVFVYTVDISAKDVDKLLKKHASKGAKKVPQLVHQDLTFGKEKLEQRPVIVGFGPAGLFAALVLSRRGYKPIVIERGEDVDKRAEKIEKFWSAGPLDPDSNVQFGEGGAGTFSDGKLTTLINDKRCRFILEEFIKAGGPKEILYYNKPHLGTDKLRIIVKNIRQEIIGHGGQVRFSSQLTDLFIEDGRLSAVEINNKERLETDLVILAIGHSARDTFDMLYKKGISIRQKPFSIGVRIEHPQALINKSQYGSFAKYPSLGPADYKLAYHSKSGRSAYTFCMCPGGYVVAAASEQGYVVTNGMSEYKRDGLNANSALLVGVNPEDFGSDHPLAGVDFQRKWERLAYELGGRSYRAPSQLVGDFLHDRESKSFSSVQPSYRPGVVLGQLRDCLPAYVIETLKEALVYFDKRLKGFAMPDAILTGVETRSSSPIRINRGEDFQSSVEGLYPIGEGAGYAGGIMSSAVDGLKAAEAIMARFAPISSP